MQPKPAVASPTSGTKSRYDSHRRAKGGFLEMLTAAGTSGSETERTPSALDIAFVEAGVLLSVCWVKLSAGEESFMTEPRDGELRLQGRRSRLR